jgi:hypothetical protein
VGDTEDGQADGVDADSGDRASKAAAQRVSGVGHDSSPEPQDGSPGGVPLPADLVGREPRGGSPYSLGYRSGLGSSAEDQAEDAASSAPAGPGSEPVIASSDANGASRRNAAAADMLSGAASSIGGAASSLGDKLDTGRQAVKSAVTATNSWIASRVVKNETSASSTSHSAYGSASDGSLSDTAPSSAVASAPDTDAGVTVGAGARTRASSGRSLWRDAYTPQQAASRPASPWSQPYGPSAAPGASAAVPTAPAGGRAPSGGQPDMNGAGPMGPGPAGPGPAGPSPVGGGNMGHGQVGAGPSGFGTAGPGMAGPGTMGPGGAGPGMAGPGMAGPGMAGPGMAGPGQGGFGGAARSAATAAGAGLAGYAGSVTAAWQNRPPGSKRGRDADRRNRRQAHLTLARVEPWSVMKFSFVSSVVAFIILFVAVAVLYMVLSALGVFTSLEHTVSTISSGQGTAGTNISGWLSMSRILGYTGMLGALNIVLITAISTIGAVIYNLIAHTIGGIEVTLRETE